MVHDKRKPITFVEPAAYSKDTEIWVMEATGEIFPSYEQYLARWDYYRQKRFTCEITGHTNLTFFEALKSETQGSNKVENTFPDLLREPVLRKVQFSTISRIDDLVNYLFDIFKEDFVPGEQVTVSVKDSDVRLDGIVRDKAYFPEARAMDGTIEREAMTRYFVEVPQSPARQALVDNKHIWRDRRSFTKHILRSFIKNTIVRERWDGAPWTVKEHVAKQFNIDTTVPAHLRQEERTTEKRAYTALKKGQLDETALRFFASRPNFSPYKGPPKGQKIIKLSQLQIEQYRQALAGNPEAFSPSTGVVPHANLPYASHFHEFAITKPSTTMPKQPQAPQPVAIKYPIDDLQVQPRTGSARKPPMKFLGNVSKSSETDAEGKSDYPDIDMDSVGPLLEIWNTLNVHAEVFVLDSFTFDDFVDAMRFTSSEIECELFVELHCAVLKVLVTAEGEVTVTLPELLDDAEDEEDEDTAENSTVSTPVADHGTPTQLENGETKSENGYGHDTPKYVHIPHRASEMLAETGWVERLQARDFKNGGWQVIVVGILYQLSRQASQAKTCETILSKLAPMDQSPTQATALAEYLNLGINLKIAALEKLIMLAVSTKTIRNYMEECSESMTKYRKDKIEFQRQRKPLIEELKALDEQRKLLTPDAESESTNEPTNGTVEVTVEIPIPPSSDGNETEDDEDDETSFRSSRRISGRMNDRKRKRDEEEAKREEKKARVEAAKDSKQTAQYKKVLKDIEKKKAQIRECEMQIAVLDGDLRESACQRTRMLGRDRFWNRYYWFERNGMPFAGLPTSSTAAYGYANGRLWVQGPDDMEVDGFINLDEGESTKYQMEFGMSVLERKAQEEGENRVENARQWGYYDDPEALDGLIAWLDERGRRERELRKELLSWREKISEYMGHMQEHRLAMVQKKAAREEPVVGIATRKKTYFDQTATRHPCLAWRNSAALDRFDQLHSDGPLPKKSAKGGGRAKRAAPAVVEKPTPRTTRSGAR